MLLQLLLRMVVREDEAGGSGYSWLYRCWELNEKKLLHCFSSVLRNLDGEGRR